MPDENEEQGVPFPQNSGDTVDVDTNDDTPDTDEDSPRGSKEEKLVSQTELDRIVQKRLKRQEETLAKKYADYDKLKEDADQFRKLQDEKATDSERWDRERAQYLSQLQEREERLSALERKTLVTDMATDASLPKNLWRYVDGSSAEEIEESIKQVKNDFSVPDEGGDKPKSRKRNAVYGGGGENESPEPDTDEIVSKIPRGPQFRLSNSSRTYK